MFTIAAINIASLAGPAKLGRRAGLAKRGGRVVVRAGEKKSAGAIHDELKEKFTTSGETFEAHATHYASLSIARPNSRSSRVL